MDPINHESLKGTGLQGTLLRARRALENLCRYEGAQLDELRASGKRCPLCGSWSAEVMHTKRSRIYECPRCGLRWDRDKGVHYNTVYSYFERLRREERVSVLAERALASLKQWLLEHTRALER